MNKKRIIQQYLRNEIDWLIESYKEFDGSLEELENQMHIFDIQFSLLNGMLGNTHELEDLENEEK